MGEGTSDRERKDDRRWDVILFVSMLCIHYAAAIQATIIPLHKDSESELSLSSIEYLQLHGNLFPCRFSQLFSFSVREVLQCHAPLAKTKDRFLRQRLVGNSR